MDRLTASDFQQAAGDDWRVLGAGASAWFDAPSQTAGAALVGRIAQLAPGSGLPDVDLRASGVRVCIDATGSALTQADVALARAVSSAAPDLGLAADPTALQFVQLAVESVDPSSVMPFWRTALAYEPAGDDVLRDPLRRDPAVSFIRRDQPRPLRDRIHVDVGRMPEAVKAVRAVAGEPYGVYQLTLADADGNEVDLVPGAALSGTADWWALFGAMTFYPTASPLQAAELASSVAGLADDAGVPLLVDLRPDGVTIDSGKDQWEDGVLGPASQFADLAGRIQTAAHDLALAADTTRLRFMQLAIDAVDVPAVRAFWTTVLGYRHDARPYLADIYDPRRLNPVMMFQQMDAAEEDRRRQRNRIHLELFVPYDQAQARLDAALSAGGRIVTGKLPGRCTLADPEGNELVLVTHA